MRTRASLAAALTLALLLAGAAVPSRAADLLWAEFRDREGGFSFRYPKPWEVRLPAPGNAESEVRVIVAAPGGGILTAIVGAFEEPVTRAALPPNPLRGGLVKKIVAFAIERFYGEIARQLEAERMEVAEAREVPCEEGIVCRVLVIYHLAEGEPLAVSAVHAVPYETSRLVNLIASVTLDEEAAEENGLFDDVLESFRLTGPGGPPHQAHGPPK